MNKQILLILFVCATALLRGQTPTASFANWKDNRKAAYTIIHDDFSEYMSGIYQYADPIATARGIKFCFGAITSPDQCTPVEWAKARTMIGHGHECINHTHNHRCGGSASACSGQQTYGPADFSTELGLSSQIIEAPSGAGVKPLFFIHPYDAGSTAIDNYLTNIGYIGARGGTQATYNESNFTDFMHLNFYVYAPGTDIATLDAAVRTTIDAGGYALREFHDVHDVTNNAPSWGSMKLADYTNHLDYVKLQIDNGNLWSATASEVITYKMQRDAYQSSVVYTAATGQVNVNFSLKSGASINTSVLKTPVTVNVNLSTLPITNTYTVSQNGESVAFTRAANILSFNVYPHEGNVVIHCENCIPPSPIVGTITQPTCTTATGSVALSGLPATGTWTINPGGITGTGTTKTVTGLAANTTYNFTVTNAAGATSAPSTNAVVNAQPAIPTPPTIDGITQPSCSVPTGTIVLGSLPTGNWTINPGTITGTGSTKTFSGLAPGIYNYTVTNDVGCSSGVSGSVNLKAVSGAPNAPSVLTVIQPTCSVSTGSVVLNNLPSGTWVINPGNISGSGVSTVISPLSAGTYNYTVTDVGGSGCLSLPSSDIVINVAPIPPTVSLPTVTQPNCPTPVGGTIVVNATTTTGTLEYSINGGTSYQSSATFNGVNPGTYTTVVRRTGTDCTVTGSTVTIEAAPIPPSVSAPNVTQPGCPSPVGGTIEVVASTTIGTLEYSINGGTSYQATPTFSGLSAGTYNIVVRRVNTLCTAAGNPVVISAAPAPPTVNAPNVTQLDCSGLATGAIVVNASTTIGTLEYSINGGTSYQSSATFSNLSAGTYNIVVRRVGTLCTTTGSAVIIETAPVPPTVSASNVTQPGCPSPVGGTIEVVASTTIGTLEYSINGGTSYQATPTFSGLSAGTYNIVVRRVGTLCTTTGSAVIIETAPVPPTVSAPNVTQPGCPSPVGGTIEVVASTTIGTLEYSINGGTSYQSSATFSNLNAGIYNIVVRRVGTLCTTAGSAVIIETAPVPPTVSAPNVTQPGCPSPVGGTIEVVASTTIGTLEYSINGGTSYQATPTFSGLSAGTYNIVVRRVGTLCTTAGSAVIIETAPSAPKMADPTVTQPLCPSPATGTIVVNATTAIGILEYSINGGTSYQSSATFSGLGVGNYIVAARIVGTLCEAIGMTVTIEAAPNAPTVGISTVTQPTCTVSTGTLVVNATGTSPLEYSLNGGAYQSSATFSGLASGTYTISVRTVGSTCVGTGTATINAVTGAPSVGTATITQPTCTVSTGTIVVNATGTSPLEYSLNSGAYQSSATFSGLASGTYTISVRTVGSTCVGTGTATINAITGAPTVGTATVTQPTCTVSTGTLVVNATGTSPLEYSLNGGAYQSSATFSGLASGTYTISVRTVGSTCVGTGTATINAVTGAPTVGTATVTQPTCTVSTGTIVVNATGTNLEYSLNSGAYQSSATFSGLASGTYTISVRTVGSTCVGTGTATINAVTGAPTVGTATVTQPTCTVSTGTLVVNATGTSPLEYSLNGGAYQSSATFSGLASGTYTISVRTVGSTCVGTGTATINAVTGAPSVGTATVTQPTCTVSTGTLVVNATGTSPLEYSLNSGAYQSSATFSGLASGTYTISVRTVGSTCVGTGTAIINAVTGAPSVGTATVTQPTCTVSTGTLVVNATGTNLEYSLNGGAYQSSATFSGLASGTYTISVRTVGSTCVGTGTATINAVTGAPTVGTATVTQPTCTVSTGTIVVNATGTNLEYSLNSGAYQSSATFSGLASGTYTISVRTVGSTCVGTGTATINAVTGAPSVGTATVTQPTCTVSTGTLVVNATGTSPLEYSLNGGAYQSSATFSVLASGTYTISVRTVGSTCVGTGTATINAVTGAPTVGTATVTQPTCTVSTGTIVVNATGTNLEYSLNGGAYQSSATFSVLASGTYTISVRTVGSTCVGTGTATINAVTGAPTVGTATVTQPTCTVSTGTLVVNATGTSPLEYSLNGGAYQSSATFSVLASGTYTISVRTVGSTCVGTGTATINAVTGAPSVGTATVTQPTCTVSTGTLVVNATGTNLEYSLNSGAYQSSATFSGLASGTYTISVRTVGSTCVGTGTATINAVTGAPTVGTATVTQPTLCTVSTGTIVVNATGTNLEYSLNSGAYQSSATFSGLASGTYTISVRTVGSTCVGIGTATINAVTGAPTVGTATVTQPTCTVSTGTLVVNATGTSPLEYSLNSGAYQSSATFSGLASGTYTISVRTVGSTCVGTGTATINAVTGHLQAHQR